MALTPLDPSPVHRRPPEPCGGLINRWPLIGHTPKYASVTPYMRGTLHWLPAAQRISCRIALFWSGGAFLVAPLHISGSSAVRYLVYPAVEPSVLLSLANSWYLVLLLQL